jgi:DNA-directed RNA polymerase specialized sigma24 family protein
MRQDEAEFAALVEHHRRELRVHCYRKVPAFDLPLRLPADDVSGTAPSPRMSTD